MARETQVARTARVLEIISRLRTTYPDAHCELDYKSPLQLLIATILSAQCSDRQVNLVTPGLFQRYPTARDFAQAPLPELEESIRRIGLYRNKARSIQAACRSIVEDHDGEVPQTMEALTQLGGVGRKTANVVLGNAFGIQVGIVVDTHVTRLSQRLGLTREREPEKIERALMKMVPSAEWTLFSHLLIWHGRRRCHARRPDCESCEVASLCPSRDKVG